MLKSFARFPRRAVRMIFRAGRNLYRDPLGGLLLLRMAFWVALLSALVRVLPLPRAIGFVIPTPGRTRTAADASEIQDRLARSLDRLLSANFLFLTPTCWKRAPVLHRYLALEGIETRIVFGVRKSNDTPLDGHAWLERGGAPLLEPCVPQYTVTFMFPH